HENWIAVLRTVRRIRWSCPAGVSHSSPKSPESGESRYRDRLLRDVPSQPPSGANFRARSQPDRSRPRYPLLDQAVAVGRKKSVRATPSRYRAKSERWAEKLRAL